MEDKAAACRIAPLEKRSNRMWRNQRLQLKVDAEIKRLQPGRPILLDRCVELEKGAGRFRIETGQRSGAGRRSRCTECVRCTS